MVRSIGGALTAAGLCLLVACDSGNPVAPAPPGNNPPAGLTVTLGANPTTIETSSSTPSMITVTAKNADGQAVDDGAQVTVTTTLGSFTQSAEPQRSITQLLNKGSVQIPLYAGTETGTANILAQVGSSVGRGSVKIEKPPEPVPAPVAEFTFVANDLSVTFTDTSTGDPTKWKWDFGDNAQSTERHPVHRYSLASTYTVTLEVESTGGKSTRQKFVSLSTGPPIAASFDFEQDPNDSMKVQFFDRSTGDPTAWSWTFGDQKTSNARNPAHTYTAAGTYTVTLVASNTFSNGTVSRFVNTAPAAPTADFDWDASGREIQFVNKSTNATTLLWDFGDDTTSSDANPRHTYAQAGSYPVTLTASNAGGQATAGKIVETDPIPAADFTFSIDGTSVSFTDKSTNSPTAWKWRFGDGSLGFDQNPVHTYPETTRTYAVTLEATNPSGTGTVTKEVKIELQ
ncbi:MAG TPA: PKD domain-containing protein [Thermoanaerobaculia bacterium]|jgi:PKD repeat protein|nr:PKD domain-containing protein [Thermoanaerobaculia bacterium]